MSATAPPPEALWPVVTGVRNSQLVYAAAKLGLADLLSGGPRSAAELAGAAGADAATLRRVLRGLVTLGVVEEEDGERFALTSLGAYLRADHPDSMRGWAILSGELHYHAWGGILHSLRTGEAALDHVLGEGLWEYLERNPDVGEHLNRELARRTQPIAAAVLRAYDFAPGETIVDVGGGRGALLAAVLEAVPGAEGILVDVGRVTGDARHFLDARGLGARCRVVAGDFFASIPAGGDVYVLKDVLHDWDDERARAILVNARRAMAPHARLLVIETMMPARAAAAPLAVQIDLQMLVVSGGRERTLDEWRSLLRSAGFELARAIPTGSEASVVEGRPA